MRSNEKTGWPLKPESNIRRTGRFSNLAILILCAFFASSEALLIKDESKEVISKRVHDWTAENQFLSNVYGEESLASIEYTPRNIGVAAGKMTCVKLTSERIGKRPTTYTVTRIEGRDSTARSLARDHKMVIDKRRLARLTDKRDALAQELAPPGARRPRTPRGGAVARPRLRRGPRSGPSVSTTRA